MFKSTNKLTMAPFQNLSANLNPPAIFVELQSQAQDQELNLFSYVTQYHVYPLVQFHVYPLVQYHVYPLAQYCAPHLPFSIIPRLPFSTIPCLPFSTFVSGNKIFSRPQNFLTKNISRPKLILNFDSLYQKLFGHKTFWTKKFSGQKMNLNKNFA